MQGQRGETTFWKGSVTHPVNFYFAPENPVDAHGVSDYHRHTDARDDEHDAERFLR